MSAALPSRLLVSTVIRTVLARRLAELWGILVGSASVGLFLVLCWYSPQDSSLNTASSHDTLNIAGPTGAVLADLLLQGFGVAAIVPEVAMLAWAWQIGSHKRLRFLPLRLTSSIAAIPIFAATLAAPLAGGSGDWPTSAGLGGAVGSVMATFLAHWSRILLGAFGPFVAWFGCLAVTACVVWVACDIKMSWWRPIGRAAKWSFLVVRSGASLLRRPLMARQASHSPVAVTRADKSLVALTRTTAALDPVPAAAKIIPESATRSPATSGVADPSLSPVRLVAKTDAHSQSRRQESLAFTDPVSGRWRLPPISLLVHGTAEVGARLHAGPSSESLKANGRLLETVLEEYGVQGSIREIHPGPVVTLYELEPAPGIRSARVIGLADDVARSLAVTAVRIATVPGRNAIGIEVPNVRRETVYLSQLLNSDAWQGNQSKLALALGKDISGEPVVADLSRMPHLLVAGTTGSGKSVGINAMILSLLYRLSPDQCRLILIDPKMLELSVYDGIPHLMAPVVTEPAKAVKALKWTVREMERRYRSMSQLGVRNVAGYNERVAEAQTRKEPVMRRIQTGFDSETGKPTFEEQPLTLEPLPLLVVVIDEMADLMMVAGKEIEAAVQRLAQMARAAGIHVIMATQRPSVDVITGTIKANFPTRISFTVISKFDSRTILGEQGAEQLLGQGDLLYMQGGGRINRVHGPFVSDKEVEDVVAFLREQGEPDYLEEITDGEDDEPAQSPAAGSIAGEGGLFEQAIDVVTREGKASTSFIQRHLSIGYNRAAKLIEQMEKEGIVSAANHVGKREVLIRSQKD